MATVRQIKEYFEGRVPSYMKQDFDNVGLLVGINETRVTRAVVALDITDDVIDEAKRLGAQLIVSHHPLFFSLKKIDDGESSGRKIVSLLTSGISAICLHTNLDAAPGGVNDALMRAIGAEVTGLLEPEGKHPDGSDYGINRVGMMPSPVDMKDFLPELSKALRTNGLRYWDAKRPVYKLACCGGNGGGDLPEVIAAGCDTYVTSDVKYDHFLMAKERGVNLIDADHFCTENVVMPVIKDMLEEGFSDIQVYISQTHSQTAQFYV